MAKKPTTGKAVKKQTNSKLSFHKQLVLNRFMFRFFKDGTLHGLKIRLGEDRFEGIHEDGQSLFFHELSNYLFEVDLIDLDELRRYDLNIVKHWQQITEHRNLKEDTVLNMKYFQYLSLLLLRSISIGTSIVNKNYLMVLTVNSIYTMLKIMKQQRIELISLNHTSWMI